MIIDLMLGDCLEIMREIPDGGVDMILTDPPYGISFQSNHRQYKHKKIKNDSSLEWLDDFMAEAYRLAASNSAHYFFCSFHHIDKFKTAIEKHFKIKNCLVWEKTTQAWGISEEISPLKSNLLYLHIKVAN